MFVYLMVLRGKILCNYSVDHSLCTDRELRDTA